MSVYMRTEPEEALSHLLGHGGTGSLLAARYQLRWPRSVACFSTLSFGSPHFGFCPEPFMASDTPQ